MTTDVETLSRAHNAVLEAQNALYAAFDDYVNSLRRYSRARINLNAAEDNLDALSAYRAARNSRSDAMDNQLVAVRQFLDALDAYYQLDAEVSR